MKINSIIKTLVLLSVSIKLLAIFVNYLYLSPVLKEEVDVEVNLSREFEISLPINDVYYFELQNTDIEGNIKEQWKTNLKWSLTWELKHNDIVVQSEKLSSISPCSLLNSQIIITCLGEITEPPGNYHIKVSFAKIPLDFLNKKLTLLIRHDDKLSESWQVGFVFFSDIIIYFICFTLFFTFIFSLIFKKPKDRLTKKRLY